MEIRKYNEELDYKDIVKLFESEDNWSCFLEEPMKHKHKRALRDSITYVLFNGLELVGYSRSIEDMSAYIYVCELLVNKKSRGQDFGDKLLRRHKKDYPDHTIYIMSDVDEYYKKLGYCVEGSIFRLSDV